MMYPKIIDKKEASGDDADSSSRKESNTKTANKIDCEISSSDINDSAIIKIIPITDIAPEIGKNVLVKDCNRYEDYDLSENLIIDKIPLRSCGKVEIVQDDNSKITENYLFKPNKYCGNIIEKDHRNEHFKKEEETKESLDSDSCYKNNDIQSPTENNEKILNKSNEKKIKKYRTKNKQNIKRHDSQMSNASKKEDKSSYQGKFKNNSKEGQTLNIAAKRSNLNDQLIQKNDEATKINSLAQQSSNNKSKENELNCSKVIDIINLRNVRKNEELIKNFSKGSFASKQNNLESQNTKISKIKTYSKSSISKKYIQTFPNRGEQPEIAQNIYERKEKFSSLSPRKSQFIQAERNVSYKEHNPRTRNASFHNHIKSSTTSFYSTSNSHNAFETKRNLEVLGSSRNLEFPSKFSNNIVTHNQKGKSGIQNRESYGNNQTTNKINQGNKNNRFSQKNTKSTVSTYDKDFLPVSSVNVNNNYNYQGNTYNSEGSYRKYEIQKQDKTILFNRNEDTPNNTTGLYQYNQFNRKPWAKNYNLKANTGKPKSLANNREECGLQYNHSTYSSYVNDIDYKENNRTYKLSQHQNTSQIPPRFQKNHNFQFQIEPEQYEAKDTRMQGDKRTHYSQQLIHSSCDYEQNQAKNNTETTKNMQESSVAMKHVENSRFRMPKDEFKRPVPRLPSYGGRSYSNNHGDNLAKDRKNSVASDLSSMFSKISDWSLEIEDDDINQYKHAEKRSENVKEGLNSTQFSNVSAKRDVSKIDTKGPYTGGLIKLPQNLNAYDIQNPSYSNDVHRQSSDMAESYSFREKSAIHCTTNNAIWPSVSNEECYQARQRIPRNANSTFNQDDVLTKELAYQEQTDSPYTTKKQLYIVNQGPNNANDLSQNLKNMNNPQGYEGSSTTQCVNNATFPMMNRKILDPGVVWYSSTQPPPSFENYPPSIYIQNYYNQVNSKKVSGSPISSNTFERQDSFSKDEQGFANAMDIRNVLDTNNQGLKSSYVAHNLNNRYQSNTIKDEEQRINDACNWIKRMNIEKLDSHIFQKFTDSVSNARNTILREFRAAVLENHKLPIEPDKETRIWKICFYVPIFTLISLKKHSDQDQATLHLEIALNKTKDLNACIHSFVECGIKFYTSSIDILKQKYCIDLDRYLDNLEPRSPDTSIRCVLLSVQVFLMRLGDLERYKEDINQMGNFANATKYYQKASYIDTRNGNPFHRLAILASMRKRKFEAVFYNIRCLSCEQPVRSSHETLVVIFDDIKKRWEAIESKKVSTRKSCMRAQDLHSEKNQMIKGTHLRKEIWIRPEGGGRRLHRTTSAQEVTPDLDELELKDMSTTDLNRRFNNTFLYIVGKLYTNINMDTFTVAAELLQKEFKILLSRSPLPIDTKRLVQIMALNMFVIEQTKMKNGDSERYRSVAQNSALHLSFGMFGVLLQRCNFLMETFRLPDFSTPSNLPQTVFSEEDLPTLLAAVKVWCDWLLGNNDTWFPIVSHEPFTELAKLATHLEKLKNAMKDIVKHFINQDAYYNNYYNQENYEMIKLGEDALLCGFNPWFCGLNWSTYRRYSHKSIPQTLAQDVRRLDTINDCIDYLEGHDPPILKWSIPDNAHISLVENTNVITSVERVNAKLTHLFSQEEDILEEAYSDEESGNMKSTKDSSIPQVGAIVVEEEGDGVNKIKKLKIRKEELERRKREDEEQSKLQKQILEEHVSVVIEVCPRQVVPDTNCFVDYLQDIQKIALDTRFQLRVPLVVLNELDGLAKGIKNEKSAKHDDPQRVTIIAEKAQLALAFLRDRPLNTKCVTYKGTILPSFGVTTEEDARQGKTNDDLILDTCINLASSSKAIDVTPTKDYTTNKLMRHIVRDIVLLTGDRNLRLKAHATDIPVNKLSDFIKWAFSK